MPVGYLIAGAGGMLGSALQRVLGESGIDFFAPDESTFDITDRDAVGHHADQLMASLGQKRRGVLVNAAAYTNVERAEDEPEVAQRVNAEAAGYMAAAAHRAGMAFVHVSTDFVFDGRKLGPYTEEDAPHPLSVYGATKLAGERAVLAANPDALIVRTAWVFGDHGTNFPRKVIAAARERGELKVVSDEIGSPTYTTHLARAIIALEGGQAKGLFHVAGTGSCTRYELALETLRLAGLGDVPVQPVESSAFPMKAHRPKNSVLNCRKAAELGAVMPPWTEGLSRFLGDIGELQG